LLEHVVRAELRRIDTMPIDHVKLPVSDLDASRFFYVAALAPFGYRLVYEGEASLGFGRGDGGDEDEPFAVERTDAPTVSTHLAFAASSPAEVDAFHAAALAAGGTDNGAPGERPYGGYYYGRSLGIRTATTSRPCITVPRRGGTLARTIDAGFLPGGR
jgi:catechol 2,3-dioxygenase-like lactoylglutathione lyase family enzyme